MMAPIEMQDLPPNNSLWAEGFKQSGKRKEFDNSYDVAIIGGGFSGLWSAYHLLKLDPKLSIVIFEAKSIGYGASGRNGAGFHQIIRSIEKHLKSAMAVMPLTIFSKSFQMPLMRSVRLQNRLRPRQVLLSQERSHLLEIRRRRDD